MKMEEENLEDMCIYKRIIEETLYPTDTSCEDCNGLNFSCSLYKPSGEDEVNLKKYGYDWS